MNEIYIVDGKRFEVAPNRKEEFLAKYPTAQLVTEEPGKEYPVGLGAPAEENAAPEQPSMDLDSAKASLDLQEEDKPIRYIEFKVNGKNQVLYEEDYMKFAGKDEYPATFDEYATLYKTTPKTFEKPIAEEVVVTAELPESQKKVKEVANIALDTASNVTLDNSEQNILNEIYTSPLNNFKRNKQKDQTFSERGITPDVTAEEKLREELGDVYFEIWENNGKDFSKITIDDIPYQAQENELSKLRKRKTEQTLNDLLSDSDVTEAKAYLPGFEGLTDDFGLTPQQAAVQRNKQTQLEYAKAMGPYFSTPLVQGVEAKAGGKTFKLEPIPEYGQKEINYLSNLRDTVNTKTESIVAQAEDLNNKVKPIIDEVEKIDQQLEGYANASLNATMIGLGNPYADEYNALLKKRSNLVDKYKNSGFAEEQNLLNKKIGNLNYIQQSLYEDANNFDNLAAASEALNLNYNYLDKFLSDFDYQLTGVESLATMAETGVLKFLANNDNNYYERAEAIKKAHVDYLANVGLRNQVEYPQDLKLDNVNDWNTFGQWTLDALSNNSLTLATVFGGGAAGRGAAAIAGRGAVGLSTTAANKAAQILAKKQAQKYANRLTMSMFFATSTGSKYGQNELAFQEAEKMLPLLREQLKDKNLTPSEKEDILKKIDMYEGMEDSSTWARNLNALLYGGIEMFAERLGTLSYVNKIRGIDRIAHKNGLGNIVKKAYYGAKSSAKEAGIELTEEILTQFGHNLADKVILQDTKSAMDGMDLDFLGNVVFTSLALQGPRRMSNVYNTIQSEISSLKDNKQRKKYKEQLMQIESDFLAYKKNRELFTPRQIQEKRAQRNELQKLLRISEFNSFQRWSSLSTSQKNQLVALAKDRNEAAKDLMAIAQSPNLGAKDYLKQYEAAEKRYLQVREAEGQILGTKKYKLEKELVEAEGLVMQPEEIVDARNMVFDTAKALVLAQGGKINELNFEQTLRLDNQKKEAYAWFDENGINLNTPLISVKLATTRNAFEANIAAVSPLHELFHNHVLNNAVFANDTVAPKLEVAIEGLKTLLEQKVENGQVTQENSKRILSRINIYKDNTKKTRLEEIMAVFEEAQLLGLVTKNDFTQLYGLKSFLNSAFKQSFPKIANVFDPFGSTEDIYNFISTFTKKATEAKMRFGATPEEERDYRLFSKAAENLLKDPKAIFADSDLSQFDKFDFLQTAANIEFSDVASSDAVVSGNMSTYEALNPDQKVELIEKLLNAGTLEAKYSKASGDTDLKSLYDAFVQNPDGSRKYKTLDEFKSSNDYALAYYEIAEGARMGIKIRSLVNADKNLGSLEEGIKKEIISNVRERVTERFLKNFDPAKNESLFGYLFGKTPIVQKALLDAKKAYATQIPKISTDAPTEGRQFEVVDTESESIEDAVDRNLTNEQQTKESYLKGALTVAGKPFVTDEIAADIRTAAYETFEGDLPAIDSRDFRKFITDSYKKKLMSSLKKTLGNKKKLAEFVVENKKALFEGLPISYWVQIERLLPNGQKIFTKWIKRLTTQAEIDKYTELGRVYTENDADGPELYQLLNPTDEQIKAFFTGAVDGKSMKDILRYDVANSTLAARKTELAANIGLQLASDATPGQVKRRDYTEQEVAKIALKLNRDPNTKFALASGNVQKIITLLEEGYNTGQISNIIKENRNDVEKLNSIFNDLLKQNGDKLYDETQEEYLNNAGFNQLTEEAGIIQVAGAFNQRFRSKGELTPHGKNQIDLATSILDARISQAKTESEKIDAIINHMRFYGRTLRAKNGVFKTNAEAMQGLYQPILDKNNITGFELKPVSRGQGIFYNNKNITSYANPTSARVKNNIEFLLPLFDKQSTEALDNFINTIDFIKTQPNAIELAKGYLTLSVREMRSPLKLLAKVSYKQKGNITNPVYEHMTPASLLGRMAMSYVISDKLISKDKLKSFLDDSKVALISKKLDTKLRKDFKFTMPAEGPIARYEQSGIDMNELEPLQPEQISTMYSKETTPEFDKLIGRATGINANEEISTAIATMLGKKKGKFKFWIPPSADDFMGLMYYLVGKGEQGNKDLTFIKESLIDPYAKAMNNFATARQATMANFKELKKLVRKTPAKLKEINESGFTNEQAVRVYIWNSLGYEIPGIENESDIKAAVKVVNNNADLLGFASNLKNITLLGYAEPDAGWIAGSATTDLLNYINKTERSKYLEQWQAAADAMFTKKTMNKLRAKFGDNYIEALEDILYRMKTGRRRTFGANKLTNQLVNWVNDSVGTIMFFNSRSALLQQLSFVNFVNLGDNNPLAVAKTIGNTKQFAEDYVALFNSDFLKQRRSGLKTDVNADEIAKAAESGENPVRAIVATILKKGFLPTQFADSHAIALGGASFYRNRINTYLKEGMEQEDAKKQAFLDFQEIAEETQQSSRPDRISMQQASPLGRIILAFANTPMQYARLSKKAFLDLANKRGDWKTNMSKLMYYTFIQNLIFSFLQGAVFAMFFNDDEEEEQEKNYRMANNMLDSILRGIGFGGAVVSVGKNMVLEAIKQAKSKRPDYEEVALRALTLSPPIDSKIRKLRSAGRTFTYRESRDRIRTEGLSLDNPLFESGGQIASALFNLPFDRVVRKIDNLSTPVRQDVETWQAISLALGYSKWDVGLTNKKKKPKRKQVKSTTKLKQVKEQKVEQQ